METKTFEDLYNGSYADGVKLEHLSNLKRISVLHKSFCRLNDFTSSTDAEGNVVYFDATQIYVMADKDYKGEVKAHLYFMNGDCIVLNWNLEDWLRGFYSEISKIEVLR